MGRQVCLTVPFNVEILANLKAVSNRLLVILVALPCGLLWIVVSP